MLNTLGTIDSIWDGTNATPILVSNCWFCSSIKRVLAYCSFMDLSISSYINFSFLYSSESFFDPYPTLPFSWSLLPTFAAMFACLSSNMFMYHFKQMRVPSHSYSSSWIFRRSKNYEDSLSFAKSASGPQKAEHLNTVCLMMRFWRSSTSLLCVRNDFRWWVSANRSNTSLRIGGMWSLVVVKLSLDIL